MAKLMAELLGWFMAYVYFRARAYKYIMITLLSGDAHAVQFFIAYYTKGQTTGFNVL